MCIRDRNNTEHSAPRGDDSGRAQVFRAAGLVASLALLSRVLGLAREIVVRQYLGVTTLEATAFDIAGRFPEAIFLIVAGGAIGSAFLPTFTAHFSRDDRAGRRPLLSALPHTAPPPPPTFLAAGVVFPPPVLHLSAVRRGLMCMIGRCRFPRSPP